MNMKNKNYLAYLLPALMIMLGLFLSGSATVAVSDTVATKMTGGGCLHCPTISTTCASNEVTCNDYQSKSSCEGNIQKRQIDNIDRKSCRPGGTAETCQAKDQERCQVHWICIWYTDLGTCGPDMTARHIDAYTDCNLTY